MVPGPVVHPTFRVLPGLYGKVLGKLARGFTLSPQTVPPNSSHPSQLRQLFFNCLLPSTLSEAWVVCAPKFSYLPSPST